MKRLLLTLALVLAACAAPPSMPVTGAAVGAERPAGGPKSQANLFVQGRTSILEYTRQGRLVHDMTVNASPAPGGGLAFDTSGNLYATGDYFAVNVFSAGSRALARTISDGVYEPLALIMDRSNNLYVANGHNGFDANIAIYPPGSSTPSRTITDGIYDPESLAFDSAGNLYVGDGLYADKVTVYSPNGTLIRTISAGVSDPESIALDSHDRLFVANTEDGEGRTVTVYAPGTSKLVQTITEGIRCPQALTLDSKGQLYVANFGNSTTTVYAAKTWTLLRTISKGVGHPWVIAADSADRLYIGSESPTIHVGIYPPDRKRPSQTIQSDGQWVPIALAFGAP